MLDIISIGESLVELFADEPIATAPALFKSYGGDALVVVSAAARLGSRTGFVTRVGRDPFESFLIDNWIREGIDTSHVRTIEGHNGLYVISLLAEGESDIAYYRQGSAACTLTPDDLDAAYLRSAKVVHTSGVAQAISQGGRDVVREAAHLVRGRGPLFSYDPNYRPRLWANADARSALTEIMPYVDIMLLSAPDESFELIDLTEPEEVIDFFWSHGVRIVVVRAGHEGCYVGADRRITHLPAHRPGPTVDTTGVGAVFNGAFLHGLTARQDPVQAARLATVMAGLTVQTRGALRSLPSSEEVISAVATLRTDLRPGS
ncbi:MAG TPA: sugar kinase [Dehalococcoidia bacterium]|nr:sugar kinase [Dehalococcoidia bacterium]